MTECKLTYKTFTLYFHSMQTKLVLPLVIVALVLSGGSFYGGTVYAKNARMTSAASRQGGFGNGSFGGMRNGNGTGGQGRGNMAGFSNGEIVSKDASSLTLKLRDGGSKIIFYSSSTTIGKMTNGSIDDVVAGENITVTGTPNQDGSIAATMIQLRPQGMPGDNAGRMAPPIQNESR